jgi:polysaccharide pyruvyl transferase WcaK-like protein
VRSEACRSALLDLGVAPERVAVGADWAWLYRPRRDRREWAAEQLRRAGVEPTAPLLLANVVNMLWQGAAEARAAIAAAFDELSSRHGFQIGFFANECREGEYFDHAAARQIRALMARPAAVLPNWYYSPDETLGLLAHAAVTVSQRYHFALESVLAGTVPVCLVRGQKMRGLVEELGLRVPGTVDRVEAGALAAAVVEAAAGGMEEKARLAQAAGRLRERAGRNLRFLLEESPWD